MTKSISVAAVPRTKPVKYAPDWLYHLGDLPVSPMEVKLSHRGIEALLAPVGGFQPVGLRGWKHPDDGLTVDSLSFINDFGTGADIPEPATQVSIATTAAVAEETIDINLGNLLETIEEFRKRYGGMLVTPEGVSPEESSQALFDAAVKTFMPRQGDLENTPDYTLARYGLKNDGVFGNPMSRDLMAGEVTVPVSFDYEGHAANQRSKNDQDFKSNDLRPLGDIDHEE